MTQGLRHRCHEIIFEADTRAGKVFDVALLLCIVTSVLAVMLESVDDIGQRHGTALRGLEWVFTILFGIEYILRLYCVRRPLRYAVSFFGVVDLLAVLPLFVSLVVPGTHSLLVVRVLRLLRVFRVFKLARFLGEANVLRVALARSVPKVIVFLGTVLTIVVIIGALMYLIEGKPNGFDSIPKSMYWAVVTLTTVGYGDLVPVTVLGRCLAAVLMVMGFGIIAVPTGIVSAELVQQSQAQGELTTQACPTCMAEGHSRDAIHCKFCGARL
ncbi:MAG: ion transporter [Planctomycetota bacterium]